MHIKKISENHDCLSTLMLLYIILYIIPTYLMMFVALSNAVCLNNAFFAIDFCKCSLFHALSWRIDT